MKKGKMFKKSISCLLAALMIIASMPFSALSASAATSVRQVAQGVRVISGSGRYKTNELTLVNDQLAGNTDIGYVTFDISGVNVATDDVITANYTFNDVIENTENNRESCGLNVYFATKNIDNDFYSSGSKGFSGITFTRSNNTYPNFISEVEQHYGLKKIASYPKIENLEAKDYSYNRTINLGPAIKEARLDGKDKLVVCFMLANKGGVDGAPWSDELVKITQTGVTVETSKIGTLVISSRAKTYSESYIGDTAKNEGYMKGFYKSGTWATQESNITRITCQENGGVYSNFSVSGPVNAVAIYDKAGKEICFPVISYNAGGSGKHDNKIQYVALPNSLETNFSMGDTKWRRCSGTNNLTEYNDHNHDFDSHESSSNKTNTFYTNEYKQWRNFVNYTGSGNTDKYYDEVTSFSWKYSGVYGTVYSATYADIPVTYGVYIVNILPLNQIITDKKSDYSSVFSDKWKYTDDSLARYYIAWQKIINFDVSSYITTGTGEEAKVAAAAVKDLVNEYNTAYSNLTKKQLTITFRKHDNSIETRKITAGDKIGTLPVNSIVDNGNKQHDIYTWSISADDCPQVDTEYTETKQSTENHDFRNTDTCACGAKVDAESFEAARTEALDIINNQSSIYDTSKFMHTVSTFVTKRANGELLCQDDFDKATYEILYAKTELKKNKGTVTLKVYDQNNHEITGAGKSYIDKDYGTEITIAPATEQNVYKYVIEKDGATSEIYGQQSISYVVTGDATVKAYCNNAQSADKKYTKVTFIVGGKISDIKYVEEGKTLQTSTANKLQFPFFTTGDWSTPTVEGSADVSSVTVRAELTPYNDNKCNVHFAGGKEASLAYNTKVDVVTDYKMDTGVDYALSTSWKTDDIIAYMHGTVFYVPARSEVYVIKVPKGESTKQPKINTVGVFSSYDENYKYVGFNCKFSLPADCTPVEWGITFIPILPSGRPDSSQVFRVKPLSAENEYTATLSLTKTSTKYSAIRAKAYLKYRDKDGVHVIEGDEHIQAFATENKFGITDINQNQN